MAQLTRKELASYIDHTALKAYSTSKDIDKLCGEAKKYGFYSVCIQPTYARYASEKLEGSNVKVCTVVGFPLGMNKTSIKAKEAGEALIDDATEIDAVMNIAKFKERDYSYVSNDIKAVAEELKRITRFRESVNSFKPLTLKVIVETCYLSNEEIKTACRIVSDARADFIKTSTGFGEENPKMYNGIKEDPIKAKIRDVALMKQTIDELKSGLKIKAAGGIGNLETALAMIDAGATRLGCSKSVNIIDELKE